MKKYIKNSLISFQKDFINCPPLKDYDRFFDYYLDLHDKLNIILLDVVYRRWHWYSIYNHKKFAPIRCIDGVIRLVPFLEECK